ncbi:FAD/NAD(P)-binding protein [Corynebacterium qintianiae]|uniref:FAD/NAD(P)-binding protein n=1 Tax=Corynebacterium qintianiae TaxID=2709392 RepID=A0A7T0KMR2_9CORY|nr:FAD/NAD(P)-binding protein [Corynebacterium qintianiae]QPK83603.1 FAD/NAD(P)-binding protein [Corynebacterium qintianiae]
MVASIALVGMGPRGISVIERIAARLRTAPTTVPLTLHLIEDAQIGAGRVWDTSQTRTLCMNTLAGAVTLFTEPGATVGAPVLEGPSLFEWIQLLRGEREEISPAKRKLFDAHPTAPHVTTTFRDELAITVPESNPSRALYGAYLRWVYRVALALLPESVRVVEHNSRAVSLISNGEADTIGLADGSTVEAGATVLSTGWVLPGTPALPGDLTHVRANNPLEQDVDALPAGRRVLVRGLGMGFFDLMALSTIDRGGRFVPDAAARSGLRYMPSGREPRLVVTSGRGYPYLPKSEYRSLPPKPDLTHLRPAVEATSHTAQGGVHFGTALWPAIVRDSYSAYYRTLAEVAPQSLRVGLADILAAIDAADVERVASSTSIIEAAVEMTRRLSGMTDAPFDLSAWVDPLAGTEDLTVPMLTEHIASRLETDISEAVSAWGSPLKAGLWVVSAARKPSAVAVENGRGAQEDRMGALSQFMAFGQMVGSGPPLFRTRELLALVDAGLVEFLGPRPRLTYSDGAVTAVSGTRSATAEVLADAFLPGPDVRTTADPLTQSLVRAGRVRPFAPGGIATSAPETDSTTRRTVHPDGRVDARLHIAGIPTGAQWADTTISPMPGTDPLFLQETDKIAASLLKGLA